jgi:hypothetical protein
MMEERLSYLFQKYLDKTSTYPELQEWLSAVADPANRVVIEKLVDGYKDEYKPAAESKEVDWEFMFEQIVAQQHTTPVFPFRRRFLHWKMVAAASILLAVLMSYIVLFNRSEKKQVATVPVKAGIVVHNDVAPGQTGAILRLADGREVALDGSGPLLLHSGNALIRTKDGKVVYDASAGEEPVVFNTMITPNGKQYQLVLADGTRVWLNAASSITYPTGFKSAERRVEISGEAYFEVAHNPSRPFIVSVNGMEVKVLGTHFNINAYSDEGPMRTTLLEGKVAVRNGGEEVVLKEGQQSAVLLGSNQKISVSNVETDKIIAWTEGLFHFDHATLEVILRELSRWYDIEVVYKGKIPKKEYFGLLSRKSRLSSVLKALNVTNVSFTIDGKKLVVQPADKN